MRRRGTGRIRTVFLSFTLAAAGAAGWVAAGYTASASGGLLPTTISLPPVTISVPTITVPTVPLGGATTAATTATVAQTTTVTTTVAGPTQTSGTGPAPAQTSTTADDPPGRTAAGDGAAVAGAVRLASGQVSVPIASVTAPAHLLVTTVLLTPRAIRTKSAHLVLLLQVSDTRGYLVRGAVVRLTSKPLDAVGKTLLRKTGTTGLARFTLVTSPHLALKPRTAVTIVARVATATRRIRVPIK